MPGTVHNFNEQLAAATEIAVDDKILIYDTSAGLPKTATPIVLGSSGGPAVAIGDVTTYAVLTANSGRAHIIGALTADTVITLPTSAAGLTYEFWFCSTAAEAQNAKISTGSATNCFAGGVVHLDADSGTGADEVVPVYSNGSSNDVLTLITPGAGTWVKVASSGTTWYLVGTVVSATAPTIADT
jgi:hypothetical protein